MGLDIRLPIRLFLILMCLAVATVAPAADDFTRPIRVSPDGRYLVQANGEPYFFLGENAEYLIPPVATQP